jgi:glycosyltransferase involved in cell wall biosynthesis
VAAARRVRIAFCIDNMGIGGTELNALRTAERLNPSRFDVSVVCLQAAGPLLARYESQGIPVLRLPVRRLHGVTALRQGARLARYLVRHSVDIVHSHDVYNNIFATAWARLARTPVVIASRRWWDDVPRAALRVVNRYAYRWADCVVANSQTVADLVVRDDRVHDDRVAVVSNFVDEAAFAPLADRRALLSALGVPPGSIVVGCIAGLRPVKDHQTLITAIASLRPRWPSLRLVLIGDGPSRPSLEVLVQRLGIRGIVHFAGVRPNEPNLHALFDIAVLCSTSEAFPNSIVEAMAAGRPVVATRVGGIADAVVDDETGLLVPPGDPAALAAAIEQLLINPERRCQLGAAGTRRARAQFHASQVLPSLEGLYDRLLESRAR